MYFKCFLSQTDMEEDVSLYNSNIPQNLFISTLLVILKRLQANLMTSLIMNVFIFVIY